MNSKNLPLFVSLIHVLLSVYLLAVTRGMAERISRSTHTTTQQVFGSATFLVVITSGFLFPAVLSLVFYFIERTLHTDTKTRPYVIIVSLFLLILPFILYFFEWLPYF